MPSLLDHVVALGEVCDVSLLERVDECEVDDDDEEGHDGRRHAGDRVARGTVAIPFLAGGGGAGSGKHGDEEGQPVR